MNDKQDDFSFVKLIDQMKIKAHIPTASNNIDSSKKLKFEPNKNIVRQHGICFII
jgi:hypothetical protein